MKYLILASLLFVGCASTPRPPPAPQIVAKNYESKMVVVRHNSRFDLYAQSEEVAKTFCTNGTTRVSETAGRKDDGTFFYGGMAIPMDTTFVDVVYRCN
jgi:hypothetical protein